MIKREDADPRIFQAGLPYTHMTQLELVKLFGSPLYNSKSNPLPLSAIRLYYYLKFMIDRDTGCIDSMPISLLAEHTGMNERTVYSALQSLRKAKIISVKKSHQATISGVLHPQKEVNRVVDSAGSVYLGFVSDA